MPLYFYFYLLILLTVIILAVRAFIQYKKNIPAGLYDKGLKNENSGHYEEALANYESALREVKKTKYHRDLKIKIVAKLKVLRTIIDYQNNFQRSDIVVADKCSKISGN